MNKELYDTVERLNEELYEKWLEEGKDFSLLPCFSCRFARNMDFVDFHPVSNDITLPEIHIYCSETDTLRYNEKNNTTESYYSFIKRRFKEVKQQLNAIKL